MKRFLAILTATALSVANAATNLVSNAAVVTNRVQGIVTYTMSNGVARVYDPSGKLIGTAEERALKVAAEGQADIASAADAAGTAMEEWRDFMATNDSRVVYIDAGFTQDLPALAPNLCGWVAGSWHDGTNDHHSIWFNREMDSPPMMCARIRSASGTNWLDAAWKDWAVTNWIDKATGREWVRPYGAEVEYLESHGTEWIIPGVEADGIDIFIKPANVTYGGSTGSWNGGSRSFGTVSYTDFSSRGWTFSTYPAAIQTNDMDLDFTRVVWRESEVFLHGSYYYDVPFQFHSYSALFGQTDSRDESTVRQASCVIGRTTLYMGDTPVMKLVPVIDNSGRPAFYDEVSGQFFYNQGTGEFAYGPILNV